MGVRGGGGGGRGGGWRGGWGGASGFRMQLCFGFASDVFAKLHIYFLIKPKHAEPAWPAYKSACRVGVQILIM